MVLASDDLGKTWSEVGPIVVDKDGKPAQAGPGVPSGYEQILCTRDGALVVVWMERKNLKWDGKTKDVLPGSTGGMWAIRSTRRREGMDRQTEDIPEYLRAPGY